MRDELELKVGTIQRILRDRLEGQPFLSLTDGLLLSTQIRQREAEKNVTLWLVRRRAKLLLEGLPRLLGVGVHVCSITLQGAGLNEAEAPVSSVVIERPRRQPQQKLSLLVVEDPDEILVGRHMGHENGRLDRRCPESGPRSGKVGLVQKY